MKISNGSIVNRTFALLACNAVPEPTAPPRTSERHSGTDKYELFLLQLQ